MKRNEHDTKIAQLHIVARKGTKFENEQPPNSQQIANKKDCLPSFLFASMLCSMSTDAQVAERSAEIAKVLVTENDLKAFLQHLETVICGEAFRGRHRSAQFLRYVVNQSVSGHCDELKERLIGVELFGRSPSYDTGEDAIVRVTASDVRRRLLQHYGSCGTSAEFRIRLPL